MCCNMPLWYGWYLTFANDFLFSCYASVTNTSNHGKNLWNCRGAPDETTCSAGFFRCHSALALIFMKLFHVCANKFSLSLSLSHGPATENGPANANHYTTALRFVMPLCSYHMLLNAMHETCVMSWDILWVKGRAQLARHVVFTRRNTHA